MRSIQSGAIALLLLTNRKVSCHSALNEGGTADEGGMTKYVNLWITLARCRRARWLAAFHHMTIDRRPPTGSHSTMTTRSFHAAATAGILVAGPAAGEIH